ncbi:MAG: GldG family protein [Burkholderiales bacterium]|nr:GldG family protein [Burkholderiales bacterium]
MDRSFRSGLILIGGIAFLALALTLRSLKVDAVFWQLLLAVVGIVLTAWGGFHLRDELGSILKGRRGEIALFTVGAVAVLVVLAHLSMRFPVRVDMTSTGLYSLSPETIQMLKRLEKPVRVTFFHDPMMRETVELYKLMAAQTDKLSVTFIDPMLNPSQARLLGVEYAGTALMESEGRKMRINGPTETDIANGILRISQGQQQKVCFLEGHGEADPFSLESHDHMEGDAGHAHGIGQKLVQHERHGIAKARHGLEALNYVVEKVSLLMGGTDLSSCAVLVVAGPKVSLLPREVQAVDRYLHEGGNALFMLDPFVDSGLQPVLETYGVVLDDTIVIDEASHFWTDISAPAVTDYNRHEITQELPLTFFPGVRSLSPTPERVPGSSVRPLVNSSKRSYAGRNPERAEFDPERDQTGPITLMVTVNRRPEFVEPTQAVLERRLRGEETAEESKPEVMPDFKPSRVIVVGDSDFATNSFFHIMGNGKLFLNAVNYLAAQENLIGFSPRTYDQPRVNLTNTQMKGTVFLSVILIPALLALIGTVVWWRQR